MRTSAETRRPRLAAVFIRCEPTVRRDTVERLREPVLRSSSRAQTGNLREPGSEVSRAAGRGDMRPRRGAGIRRVWRGGLAEGCVESEHRGCWQRHCGRNEAEEDRVPRIMTDLDAAFERALRCTTARTSAVRSASPYNPSGRAESQSANIALSRSLRFVSLRITSAPPS